ncbi:MAG: sigma-70 family RNA polymerase sigma factor [Myxococcota bacterium]
MQHRQRYTVVVDEAFEGAIFPHLGELYGTAVRLTRSRAEADDLLQESMLRAWSFWDRFQKGTNARAWMHRILMNTFINGYRRRKRERELLAEVDRDLGERPFEAHASWEARAEGIGDEVHAALAELPAEFRQVVILVDFDDLSYKEVADALGCPIGTVMSRLHRGRRTLKRQLRDYAHSEGYVQQAAA